ncbi:MAG: sigma 54-interacting transcriptional regulator, partial [Polyangiaceae bacterium]|nr:sigma 54-interacting transcriptional regulator [Polyangiaceae bacterium]
TGKGALAEWIHRRSSFGAKPFVALNCATLRGDLLASELFGHARGAFTSAVSSRRGLIEEAAGGTLFLDEIGEMDLEVQSQLLKVLEEKTFRRVGESKVSRSDFRLICATNGELDEAAQEGTFRRDLLYRIDVLPIALPPLRERPEDIDLLARALLDTSSSGSVEIPEETVRFLAAQRWPGNVRELRNTLIRATLLSRGRILRPEHFDGFVSKHRLPQPASRASVPAASPSDERSHILELLERYDGNRAKVARSLGVARSSLYRKLKAYGID